MKLIELGEYVEEKIGVDLFDFALSDIIDFDSMVGSVSDKDGEEIIYFDVITKKGNISYFIENYTDDEASVDCIGNTDIEVKLKPNKDNKMKLRRWDNNEVIFEKMEDCESWEELLKGALEANVSLEYADFSDADFSNADFRGTDFSNADFSNADFSGSFFIDADFSNADFRGTDFSNADFRNTDFSCADFRNTDFRNTDFRGTDFSGADFIDVSFSKAIFRNTVFKGTDFSGSFFIDADFRGSDFSGSKHQFKIGNMKEWHSMQLEEIGRAHV